jgi:hypothetical protein
LAGSALAQDAMKGIVVKPDALTWKENPSKRFPNRGYPRRSDES